MGTRSEHIGAAIADAPIRRGYIRQTFNAGVIADNYQIEKTMPSMIALGAAAAVDVLLPDVDANDDGLTFTFKSTSSATTGVLTFKDAADTALSPAVTLAQNLSVEITYFHGLGWKAVG